MTYLDLMSYFSRH